MSHPRFSRRALLGAATTLPLLGLLPRSVWAGPSANVEAIETISLDADFYHGWPTLLRRKNGELLLVYSGGREGHVCPFGRVELLRSHDDGRTWTWPQTIFDGPLDDRDAGLVETSAGTLVMSTFTSLAYEPLLKDSQAWSVEKRARWQAARDRLSPADARPGLAVGRSARPTAAIPGRPRSIRWSTARTAPRNWRMVGCSTSGRRSGAAGADRRQRVDRRWPHLELARRDSDACRRQGGRVS